MKLNLPIPLRNGILALLICVFLVLIAYYYIDEPVAYWVYDDKISSEFFKLATNISVIFTSTVIFVYAFVVVRWCYKTDKYMDKVLLAMTNSLVIFQYIKEQLKFVFGRYWPETWVDNNPSLINNHAYGFHFFQSGTQFSCFPSGHAGDVLAVMMVLWFSYPRFKWLFLLPAALVSVALVCMDYHFVSDVIAGNILSGIIAYYVVKISNLKPAR